MLRILTILLLVITILPTSLSIAQDSTCDTDTNYAESAREAISAENWQGVVDAGNCLLELEDTGSGYYYRGIGYYQLAEYELAVADLEQVLEIGGFYDAFLVEIHYYLGASYYYLDDDDSALENFAMALVVYQDIGYNEKILYFYSQEEIDSAVAAINPTTTTATPTPEACDTALDYYTVGWDALDSDDYTSALTAFTCALENDYEDSTALAEIYRLRGEAYQLLGDDISAVTDFNSAIELYAGDWYTYLLRGISYMYAADNTTALADFATALELDPDNDFIWYYIGLGNYYAGDDTTAIEAFTQAITLNPDDSLAYAFRAQSYFITNADDAALTDIASAIELGEEPLAYLIWGQILYYQGDFETALEPLNKAIELGADNPDLLADAYNYRGQVYYYLEDDDAAVEDLSQAVSYGEGTDDEDILGEAYSYRGQSKLALDDAESATKDLNYATVFQPENPVPYFFLGRAYERRGDPNAPQVFYAYSAELEEGFTDFMQGYDPNFDPRIIENYQGDPKEAIDKLLPPPDRSRFNGFNGGGDGAPPPPGGTMPPPSGTMPPPNGTQLPPGTQRAGTQPPPNGTMPPPNGTQPPPMTQQSGTQLPPPTGAPNLPPPTNAPQATPPPPPPPTNPPPGLRDQSVLGKPIPQIGERALLFARQISDRTIVRARTLSSDRTSSFGTGRRSGARRASGSSTSTDSDSSDSSFRQDFSTFTV